MSGVLKTNVVAVVLTMTAAPALAQELPDDIVIKLERTHCGGECPVYSVTIDALGNVTWNGKDFVRVKGLQTDRVDVSRVAALLATADQTGFFDLRDQYRYIINPDGSEKIVTDQPTLFVTITRSGRSKRVEDYFGAPPGLRTLEQQIDETARTKRWIRIDQPTLQRLLQDGWFPSVDELAELLRQALMHDEVDVVEALLAIGADPNRGNHDTNTPPLMMVRSAGAARALIRAGAVAFVTSDNGWTPLAAAVHLPSEVTEVLIKAGVHLDQPLETIGKTALWHAACRGNAGVVSLLLKAGADPSGGSPSGGPAGISALECARQGRDAARSRKPSALDSESPFVQDFDSVIASLEQALVNRRQR